MNTKTTETSTFSYTEYAFNNSDNAAPGLAPDEVHIERLPPSPRSVFDRAYSGIHQKFGGDQFSYCNFARDH